MKRIRSFWRAFLRALADEYGTKPIHESVIKVDMDTTLAEEKLDRMQAKVLAIQAQLSEVGGQVNRINWTLSSEKFQA